MGKKPSYLKPLYTFAPLEIPPEFMENLKTAVLTSLAQNQYITPSQFERCCKNHSPNASISPNRSQKEPFL